VKIKGNEKYEFYSIQLQCHSTSHSAQPNPTHGWTQPMSISVLGVPSRVCNHIHVSWLNIINASIGRLLRVTRHGQHRTGGGGGVPCGCGHRSIARRASRPSCRPASIRCSRGRSRTRSCRSRRCPGSGGCCPVSTMTESRCI